MCQHLRSVFQYPAQPGCHMDVSEMCFEGIIRNGGGESFRRIPSWCSGQRLAHVSAAGVSAAPTEAAWTSTMTSFVCWVLAQKDLGKGVLVISSSCFLDNLKTFSFKYRVGTCSHQLRLP